MQMKRAAGNIVPLADGERTMKPCTWAEGEKVAHYVEKERFVTRAYLCTYVL